MPYFGPDLEHPAPRPVPSGGDVLEPLDRERQVDVLGRDGGRPLVADRPGVERERRVRVELLAVVVHRDVARELELLRAPVDRPATGPPADRAHGRGKPHRSTSGRVTTAGTVLDRLEANLAMRCRMSASPGRRTAPYAFDDGAEDTPVSAAPRQPTAIIASNGWGGGPAEALLERLLDGGVTVTAVTHPLLAEHGGRHDVEVFSQGARVRRRRYWSPLRPTASFALDPLIPPILPKADVFFGFNPLAAARDSSSDGSVDRAESSHGALTSFPIDLEPAL